MRLLLLKWQNKKRLALHHHDDGVVDADFEVVDEDED